MAENENPLGELTTTTTNDPRSHVGPELALSVSDVVANYKIGNSTLRKRLAAGELVGAYKVKAGTGEAWAIPITTLDAAGIVRKELEDYAADLYDEAERVERYENPEPPAVLAVLEGVVDRLTTLYEASTRQLEAAQGDRNKALVEAADAKARLEMLEAAVEEKRAEVERERARADDLATELAAVKESAGRRRGWFRR
jgi:hypothetical protein